MGEDSEGLRAGSRSSENDDPGSGEAHHVGISPQEDRGVSKSTVGEAKGGAEEGSVAMRAEWLR